MDRSRGKGRTASRSSGRSVTPQGRNTTPQGRSNTPQGQSTTPQGRPSLRGDTAKNTSPQSSQSPAQKSTSSPRAQRRNVTDLGIRRPSPARLSPSSARGRSPVRTTRAAAAHSPASRGGSHPRANSRSTRADSKSPNTSPNSTEGGTRGRNPVRVSSTDGKKIGVSATKSPLVRNSPRAKPVSPNSRGSPRAKQITPVHSASNARSGKPNVSPRASPRAVKKISPNRSKTADSSKSEKVQQETIKRTGKPLDDQAEESDVSYNGEEEEEQASRRVLRKSAANIRKTPQSNQKSNVKSKVASMVTGAQNKTQKPLTLKRTDSGANSNESESASGATSPAPSEKSSVYNFDNKDPEDSVTPSSPGFKKYRSPEKKPVKRLSDETEGSAEATSTRLSTKPKIVPPAGKGTVTLEDGTDVTETLHDLPVGISLIVRRADGATMSAIWNGEKLASPIKVPPPDEDAKMDADFAKTVDGIQERSSKNTPKVKPSKVISAKSELEHQEEKVTKTLLSGKTKEIDTDLKSPRVVLSRMANFEPIIVEEFEESDYYPTLELPIIHAGCGRRGVSKLHDSNIITAERRIHIALVAAAVRQARYKVAQNKRSRGRPLKVNSDDPWAGGLSPSAKAFTMFNSPKFSSPRSVQFTDSIKTDNSAEKMSRKMDSAQGAATKIEENGDLEVQIVPKFSVSRTFRSPSHADSDDDLKSTDLNETRKRRGRPKKSYPVIERNKDSSDVLMSPKTVPVKKVTIVDGSSTPSAKVEHGVKSTGGRRSLQSEPNREIARRDRRSLPTAHSVQDKAKGAVGQNRKNIPKRNKDNKEKSASPLVKGKQATKSKKINDGSRASGKLLKSKMFKEAAVYDAPLIRDVEVGHRAVTVHKVIPAHLLKPVSLAGFKISTKNIKITPSKVVLTKLEVSPEEALNRLLVIEALLTAQKSGRKVAGAKVAGKSGKSRAKVKQEPPAEKTETLSKLEEWQRMLAQHVLPMRKSLTSDDATSPTNSQGRDTSPGSEASVSSAGGKRTPKDAAADRKPTNRSSQPAKRGRRLRTESWTISEDKALHAATAVADVIMIPDQEESAESEDVEPENDRPEEKADVKSAPVKDVKSAPVKDVKNAPVKDVKSAPVKDVKNTPVIDVKSAPVKDVKSAPAKSVKSAPVKSVKSAPVKDEKNASLKEPTKEENNPGKDVREGKMDTMSGPVKEPAPVTKIPEKDVSRQNRIVAPVTVALLTSTKPVPFILGVNKPTQPGTVSPQTDTSNTSKTVKDNAPNQRTDSASEKETLQSPPSEMRESFDTSCESLRLVLEDDGSGDSDADPKNHGSKPTGIPESDSMPELSKICDQPADRENNADLTVPQLSPVKEMLGKGELAQTGEDSGLKESTDENVQSKTKESKHEEMLNVEAVNSQLMADLTKSTPMHDDVVVLATWSVSSEDDTELDVTGATADSMEDGAIVQQADKLKKSVEQQSTDSTTALQAGKLQKQVAQQSTDSPIVTQADKLKQSVSQESAESSAPDLGHTLVDLQEKVDAILAQHISIRDIEEEILSDVREQIDDIVTAVELNESRDEELSRSHEASPEKDVSERKIKEDTKDSVEGSDEVRDLLDDIVTAVELNESNSEKGLEENDREKPAEDEKKEEKKKEVSDSFEEYLLQGENSVEEKESSVQGEAGKEVERGKEKPTETKDKPDRQSGEDSDRIQPDLYSQDSLESGSGGFDVQFSDSPHIPLGLMSAASPTDHLNDDSADDEVVKQPETTIKKAEPLKAKNSANAEVQAQKVKSASVVDTVQDEVVNELNEMVNEAVKDIENEASGKDRAETKGTAKISERKRVLLESETTGRRGSLSVSKPEEYTAAVLVAKRRSSGVEQSTQGNSEANSEEKQGKVWMHVRAPNDKAAEKSTVVLDCSREFKKAFDDQEQNEKDGKVKEDSKSQKAIKGRSKGAEPNVVSVRKRRELNRLKTDMVGAENIFDAVVSGDEEGSMQRRTRRAKRQRSPADSYLSDEEDGHKRSRSEHREVSTSPFHGPKVELKRRVPTLAKLAKTALPPGTNPRDIPKIEPPHKQKPKVKKRRSPWTVPTKRRSKGGASGVVKGQRVPPKSPHEAAEAQSEEDGLTENEADISQESIPVHRKSPKQSPLKTQSRSVKEVPIETQQRSAKEGSIEPEIAQLDPGSADRPPSKYHIPSPTRMKTRGKRTNVLSMVQDYLEFSPERELPPVVRPKVQEGKSPEQRIVEILPDADASSEMNDDFSDRVISGSLEELKLYCKPCSVVAVDFIRCLDLEQLKKSPGSTSPGSARSPRVLGHGLQGASAAIGGPSTSYHMDSSTEEEEDTETVDSEEVSAKNVDSKKESSLTPEKATTAYEAQFLSFLNKPDKKPSQAASTAAAKPAESTSKGQQPKTQAQQQQQQPPEATQGPPKARFCCKHCTYSNNSRTVMQEHIYNHTPVVPYSCGYCSAIFGTKSGVISHNKREHKNSPPMVIKTNEVNEEEYYVEHRSHTPTPTQKAQAAGVKRKAESPVAQPALKRKPTARKSVARPGTLDTSVVASLLQSPPQGLRASSPASSGSLKMKFSLTGDKKEAILMSGPSGTSDDPKKSVNKVTPRPRIPMIEQVDPDRPYYQCRHCTFASHNLPYIENHVNQEHSADQRYVCPLCDLAYCKYEDGMRKHFGKWHPGQPVMLIMQPLYDEVHLKDAAQGVPGDRRVHQGASKSLEKDANVVQVLNRKKLAEKKSSNGSGTKNSTSAVPLDDTSEEGSAGDGKRTVSPLILKVPAVGGKPAGVQKARKQIVKNKALTGAKADTEKRNSKKKSASPSDYMCKEISSTSGDNMEPMDNETERPRASSAQSSVASGETSKSSTPGVQNDANQPENTSQSDGLPGLQIVSVMSLAGSELGAPSGGQNQVATPAQGTSLANEEYVDKTIYECKKCGEKYESLDRAIEHIDTVHQQEYWYACPYCPFGCSKHKNNMIRHIRRAHPQKPERQDIGLINQENHFKTQKIKVSVSSLRAAGQQTILQVPSSRTSGPSPPKLITSQVRQPGVAPATISKPPSQQAEEDDELIFVSAQPGKPRAPGGITQQRAAFRSPFGRGNRMLPQTSPHMMSPAPRPLIRHQTVVTQGRGTLGSPVKLLSPGRVGASPGGVSNASAQLDMDCESVDDSFNHDDSVTEDSDYVISTNESKVINVAPPGDDSPQDLSAGSSRENTPERSAVRVGGTPGRPGVLNVPSLRNPPPAHRGSPNITQQGRTVSPEKSAGMAGSPGLASLEQLTAGIGNMPPPLSKAVPSPPPTGPKPAHATKPMPPLTHIPSGRVSGPPPIRQPPPPRLTPANIRPGMDPMGGVPRQAPPLQRAPSPAHAHGQPLSTRPPMGRGNPSVAVVMPMPAPKPPTPPEPSSPVDDDEFMTEEEAKRAFSVFNIQPNRARPAVVTSTPAAATNAMNSVAPPPAAVPTLAPPRPVVTQPSEPDVENDFSQFQVRPGPRGAPRYPTHAAGYGLTPPNGYSPMTPGVPPRVPPPPYHGSAPPPRLGAPNNIGTAQFLCPYCPYEGPGSSALKNHILTHQPNIQWICPYCPGPTRMTKTEVTSHIQTVHPACQLVYIPYGVNM